ncbi:DinB family protein [Nonomuraea sp. NPDC026600]|uniref:DinB family protein n=1 Tax=Nonomuraea sp. NPDC026600 TaxID=3155363 RepID=UPI0034089631
MYEIPQLLAEYDRARAYTDELWRDLTVEELHWRPEQNFSPIGWHLGHQAHVAHFMVRNLTAAEPSPAPDLGDLMDSANPEANRLPLPDPRRLADFRATVGERVHARMNAIGAGDVAAPAQLKIVAQTLLMTIINHEYQHDRWIGEVRNRDLGHALPDDPISDLITTVDGYLVVCGWNL